MKRTRNVTGLLAVLALALSACGGDGNGDTTSPPADLTGQSVEIMVIWAGAEQENFEKAVAPFEQDTGADVTVTSAGDDLPTVLGTRIEGGNPPDIALIAQPGLLSDLAGRNVLKEVENTVGSLVDRNYAGVWRDLATVNDTLYGVWFKADNKSTAWYNVKVFNDAGVDPPKTWDELLTTAQTIADFGVTPFSMAGADGWTLTDWFENVYLRTAGGDKYDQLAAHEIPWTDESVKVALRELAKIFGKPDWMLGGTSGALQNGFDASVPPAFSSPPRAAMVVEGAFVADVILSNTSAKLGDDADFFDFPSIDDSPPAVMGSGNVAVLLKDSEAGREMMRYLATAEPAQVWAKAGGFNSPNKDVDLAVYPSEIARRTADALVKAETFRFDMSDLQPAAFGATSGQGMWGILQEFLRNPSDVDGIAQKLETAAERAFG